MKVSINWMKWYGGKGLGGSVGELATKIGAQLGALEEVSDVGAMYTGVLIVAIISCDQHPNADRLHICKVDDGGKAQGVERDADGYVQIVCGAPNVRAGMHAVWLAPGITVPNTVEKDPFVLEARELRGVISNGMLASPKELALGDSHDGILEIDTTVTPGSLFADTYGLANDYVLDIENKMFTHRPDCFGQLGVAREIAGISGERFISPDWYRTLLHEALQQDDENLSLIVENELPELVPRFTAIVMSNITIAPSPVWLQTYLSRVGVRPISNIVDLTNYMMLLTGQPLHAYDYDKVRAQDAASNQATLVVRKPRADETIILLSGKEVTPRADAIMIATRDTAIGIGGVMGGGNTEVDEHTKNIIIECATFDMYSIRRTSMAHGLFTDAVTRFNKGQSPLQNLNILAKIVSEIRHIAGGKVASSVIDNNHVSEEALERNSVHASVSVTPDFINARLGLHLSADEITALLENVEFMVEFEVEQGEDMLVVTAPFWRTDIEIPEDIVEEVGRLHGFDSLPLTLPVRSLSPMPKNALLEVKARIRNILSRGGANEILTYSFVHGNVLDKVGQQRDAAFRLANALSPELQYYRLSLMPSLLERVHPNVKAGYDEFVLFEIGKAHDKSELDADGLPVESEQVAVVYANRSNDSSGAAYYQARKFLIRMADTFGVQLACTPLARHMAPLDAPFDLHRSAIITTVDGGQVVGVLGEFTRDVLAKLKLPTKTAGFEISLDFLLSHGTSARTYTALPRFPKIAQDVCLRVAAILPYQQLFDVVSRELQVVRPKDTIASFSPVDIYQRADDVEHKQITLRLTIASYERTLTDEEVTHILTQVTQAATMQLHAEPV